LPLHDEKLRIDTSAVFVEPYAVAGKEPRRSVGDVHASDGFCNGPTICNAGGFQRCLDDPNMPICANRRTAKAGSILIFDGVFLHRPEFRGYWDLSIFLQVDFAVSVPRALRRNIEEASVARLSLGEG